MQILIECPDCDYQRAITPAHPMFHDWALHGVPPAMLLCPNCDEGWGAVPPHATGHPGEHP